MEGNPYSELLKALQPKQDGPRLGMRLGTVTAAAPLSVRVSGVDIPASAFRTVAEPGFEAGDKLLLLTEDDQMFYIMGKVVDAE